MTVFRPDVSLSSWAEMGDERAYGADLVQYECQGHLLLSPVGLAAFAWGSWNVVQPCGMGSGCWEEIFVRKL